jgi:hypothetical protein
LERKVLRQKKLGISYAAIADLINQAAAGQQGTGVVLPDPDVVVLPPGYTTTAMTCNRAVRRTLAREPRKQAEEYRDLATARLEDWLLNMAARIRAGDTQAINTAISLLKFEAELNGYAAPVKIEHTGQDGGAIKTEAVEVPLTDEQRRARALEIAQFLKDVGGLPEDRGEDN